MPQIFSRSANTLTRASVFAVPLLGCFLVWGVFVFGQSSYGTGSGIDRVQPVPFSHEHHVGVLGIDCRYCHTSVENSSYAGMPPTKTCMNCHSQIWVGSDMLEPVRESYRTDDSLHVAARLQPARLRLLRPQHPRPQRRRLLDLPRPDRRDAVHVPGAVAADGVVPGLPPQPGAEPSAARRCSTCSWQPPPDQLERGPRAGRSSTSFTTPDTLPLARCATDEPAQRPVPELADLQGRLDGAQGKKYWRTAGRAGRHRRLSGVDAPRVPGAGGGLARAAEPAPVPDADGRLAGPGRRLAAARSGRPRRSRSCPTSAQPEEVVPGKPLFFATAMTLGGAGVGLLVESHVGRPTKIEGNPDHPASLGATDPFTRPPC